MLKLNKYTLALTVLVSSINAFSGTQVATLQVENMDCPTCTVVVKAALNKLKGVEKINLSTEQNTVEITFDDSNVTPSDLANAVTNAGFPAKLKKD